MGRMTLCALLLLATTSACTPALAAVAAAPAGSGANNPENCTRDYTYGDEIVVVRSRAALGPADLVIRYASCDHRGFDDGVTVRQLTDQALALFLTGPHQQQ